VLVYSIYAEEGARTNLLNRQNPSERADRESMVSIGAVQPRWSATRKQSTWTYSRHIVHVLVSGMLPSHALLVTDPDWGRVADHTPTWSRN
jgi:hypothetical protein